MRNILLWIFILFYLPIYAQLTLTDCQELAVQHFPLSKQYKHIAATLDAQLRNASQGFFPQVNLSSRVSWQTDVTEVPLVLPDITIPSIDKLQFLIELNVQQVIYDGGKISNYRKRMDMQSKIKEQSVDVSLYDVKKRVIDLYFSLLLLRQQLDIDHFTLQEIKRNRKMVGSLQSQGMASSVDIDFIEVNSLLFEQRQAETEQQIKTSLELLSLLIGREVKSTKELVLPNLQPPQSFIVLNPISKQYDLQMDLLELEKKKLRSAVSPSLGLFARGLYGRPGLDWLKNNAEFGLMVGIKLEVPLTNLYALKSRKGIVEQQRLELQSDKEAYILNTKMYFIQQQREYDRILKAIASDKQIVAHRTSIAKDFESKFRHGNVTMKSLLDAISETNKAKHILLLHEIQLQQKVALMLHTTHVIP